MTSQAQTGKLTTANIVRGVLLLVVLLVLPFLLAGRLDWWGAWANAALVMVSTIGSRVIVARRNPDLLVERGRTGEHANVKSWDRRLAPLVALYAPILTLVVASMNFRFDWAPRVPLWLQGIGFIGVLLGYAFSSWAMVANRFFSGMVRIQAERGHSVVTAGPYRYVRHPGYAGSVASGLALPLLLGTAWAFVPTLVHVSLIIMRTRLEDRVLQAELAGYAEYAGRTKYRLVPGLW